MKRQEAEQLVKEAIALAMSRDGSSGGVIRCVTVHAGGADRSLVLPEVRCHSFSSSFTRAEAAVSSAA